MPRGPRRNLRPVAERMSQPIVSTSTGICPTDWQASSRYGTPAARASGAHRLGRVHQPAVGGHVGDRDQPDRPARRSAVAAGRRPRSGRSRRSSIDLDDRAGARGDLQEGDDVAGVLGPGGQDPVARPNGMRVEGHVPGPGRVLDEGDLVGPAADEPRDGGVGRLDLLGRCRCRLVAADRGLARRWPSPRRSPDAAAGPHRRC